MKLNCSLTRLMANSMIILFALFFVCGCTMPCQQDALLHSADSLMKSRPDSALILLENISPDRLATPADRAKYALLLTQAQDKKGILHVNDSLIRVAVDYYKDGKEWMQAAKAYFYLGSVYRDLGEDTKAVDAFLKAKNTIPVESRERLLLLTCINLCSLYEKQNMYAEAQTISKESYQLSINRGNSIEIIYALNDLSHIFLYLDQPDSAIYYLSEALKISELASEKVYRPFLYTDLAYAYKQKEEYHIANACITEALKSSSGRNIHSINISKGSVLTKLGELDSARYYLLKDIEGRRDIYSRASTYSNLYNLEKEAGNYKEATCHVDSFIKLNGAIELQKRHEEIVQLINKQKLELYKKNILIKEEYKKRNLILSFIVLLGITISGSGFIIWQRRKRIKELNEEIKSNRIAILKIAQQLEEVERPQEKEVRINQLKIICFQNLSSSIQLFVKTPTYKRLQEINQRKTIEMLPSKERETIISSICDNFPEVISNLRDLYGLTVDDAYYCVLFSMKFSNTTVSVCMGVAEGAYRTRKTRIKNKMGEKDYLRLSEACFKPAISQS